MLMTLSFLFGSAFTIVVVKFLFIHVDETQKWLAYFFSLLSKVWKGFQYQAIRFDLESKINSFVGSLNAESTLSFPRIAIKWAGKNNDEVIWEEGRILLVMRDKGHNTKNLVHAAYLFVSETLLRRSKIHISKSQKVALDLFATKLILEKESPSALEHFIAGYFVPELQKHDRVTDFLKQFINIQKVCLFFPILVQELTFLGNTIYLEKPRDEIVQEVNALINFLETFSKRRVGDTTNETFTGKYMRCAIRVIASKEVRRAGRIDGVRSRLLQWIEWGYPNIYLIGGNDTDNRHFMEDVVKAVQTRFPALEVKKTYVSNADITFPDGTVKNVQEVLIHLHYPESVKYVLGESDLRAEHENGDNLSRET